MEKKITQLDDSKEDEHNMVAAYKFICACVVCDVSIVFEFIY